MAPLAFSRIGPLRVRVAGLASPREDDVGDVQVLRALRARAHEEEDT